MIMATLTLRVDSAHHMGELGAALAGQVRTGECVALRGDLGAGKTTFARGFIRSLSGQEEEIVSPTFTLVQSYDARDGRQIWHFDLYRLEHERETQEIGFDDALASGISLVEWPEIVRHRLPSSALDVHIAYVDADGARSMTLKGDAAVWSERFNQLEAHAR